MGTRAIGLLSAVPGLAIVLLLTLSPHFGPLAANAIGCAASVSCFVALRFRRIAEVNAKAIVVIDTLIAVLICYGASALVLAILSHQAGADPRLAQTIAIAAFTASFAVVVEMLVVSSKGTEFLRRSVAPLVERPRLVAVVLAGVLVLCLAYLTARVLSFGYDAIDFRYFWLAGELWGSGRNPYDQTLFAAEGARFASGVNNPLAWLYPPWWWAPARAVSTLPYAPAQFLWRLLMAGLLLAGVAIFGRKIARRMSNDDAPLAANGYCIAMLVFACTMSASGQALSLGQPSHLLLLGLMMSTFALLSRRRWLGGAGLVVLAMKPQIGLLFGLYMLASRGWFRVSLAAGLMIGLLAVPAILVTGVEPMIRGFGQGLDAYNEYTSNQAIAMPGMRHLVFELTGRDMGGMTPLLPGGVIALATALSFRARTTDAASHGRVIGLILLLLLNFAPIHTYETVYVVPVIALMISWPALVQIAVGLVLLVLYRSDAVAHATNWWDRDTPAFHGATVDSIGFVALLSIWILAMVRERYAAADGSSATVSAA